LPESLELPRPHLLVQHLLKQLESHVQDRDQRDLRPVWLADLVQQAADAFAPLSGVARVGYECEPSGDGWEARFYVGATELIGGKDDGQFRQSSFELNLADLVERFTRLEEFRWNVAAGEQSGSFVTIRGRVGDQPVCLKAYSRTPEHIGPALRQYHDGRIESVM
jgi:hypothetical protein